LFADVHQNVVGKAMRVRGHSGGWGRVVRRQSPDQLADTEQIDSDGTIISDVASFREASVQMDLTVVQVDDEGTQIPQIILTV
jgi:hypothetical protein